MPCIIALIIFSVLGIFSASHRKLAKEAFGCVFRRVTLRPCDTGFDTKVKAKVLGSLINRSPKVAKFVNKRFELLSWVFALSMMLSTVWVVKGVYNFWAWGSCNGLNQSGFCAFDPTGENNKISSTTSECVDPEIASASLSVEYLDLNIYPTLMQEGAEANIVFMGCYSCDFTRKTYPTIKELMSNERVNFTFVHFPTKDETKYLMQYDYCINKEYPDKFFGFVDELFSTDNELVADENHVLSVISEMGMDTDLVGQCVESEEANEVVETWLAEAEETGIYGTPTVFIDGVAIVGPKPYRIYRRLVQGSLF